MKMNCRRQRPWLSPGLRYDGAPELIGALASESAYKLETNTMEWNDKTKGFVRHVLTSIGGAVVLLGYTDAGTVEMVIGAMMTLFGFIWSWQSKS